MWARSAQLSTRYILNKLEFTYRSRCPVHHLCPVYTPNSAQMLEHLGSKHSYCTYVRRSEIIRRVGVRTSYLRSARKNVPSRLNTRRAEIGRPCSHPMNSCRYKGVEALFNIVLYYTYYSILINFKKFYLKKLNIIFNIFCVPSVDCAETAT